MAGALPVREPFDARTWTAITGQLGQQVELLAALGDEASSERLLRSTERLRATFDPRELPRLPAAAAEASRPAALSLR